MSLFTAFFLLLIYGYYVVKEKKINGLYRKKTGF